MLLILKGMIIGIGKIIPGVSGSMLAISLGIYEKLVNSINDVFKNPKKNLVFLLKIAIGVIISVIFFSKIILSCLSKYYIVTMFLFIGLIIGGFDDITKNINKKDNYLAIIFFALVTLFGIININNEVVIENAILNSIYFVFMGFVDAITTVVPGISGTATLMMLGAYTTLIKSFSSVFDIYYFSYNLQILVPFIIGLLVGIVVTAKIINYLFKNYKSKTYSVILGFSLSTIVIMFVKSFNSFYTIKDLIIATILLFAGVFITKKINHLFND